MHVGRSGVEGDLDVVFQHVRQQAVDAGGGGLQAHLAGAGQAFGAGSIPTIQTGSSTGLRWIL
jgi:hypothetical protein